MNIFLATDYSNTVMNAERYAFEFAKKTNSTLTILHVYEIPFSFPVETSEYIKESDELRKYELQKLKLHCETLAHSLKIKQSELSWECIVLEGPIEKEIRNEAKRTHPDLIIAGSHDTNSFMNIFQGNHNWEIIKKATTPILSVPQNALFKDIKKIAFATEYRKGEISGIQFLIKLAEQFDSELTILHVSNQTTTKEFESTLINQFKTEVQDKAPNYKLNLKLVYSKDIADGINECCISNNIDWLVMSHSKTFVFEKMLMPGKSITKEMSLNSNIPLLAIPDFYVNKKSEVTESISETLIFKNKDFTPG